jgi:GH25 family lysozyme M1 (1,4-beta-N-acetylmuramidase)
MAAAVVVASVAIPVATGVLPSASASKVIEGPDTSHYQHGDGAAINWKKVAKDGMQFAISKATEGTADTDSWFASDYAGSAAAGLVHGSYHYAQPSTPIKKSAKAQAKFFAATIGKVTTKATLPPALDLELTGGLGRAQLVAWAQDFLLDMRGLTGRTPMLYTYPSFYDDELDDPSALSRYPLWMAEYGTSIAPTSNLWQYTDDAHIDGIPGGVDESKFTGTSGFAWSTLSDGKVATPWVAAAPASPLAVRATTSDGSVTVSWLPGDAGTSKVTGYTVTASPGHKVVAVGGSTFATTIADLSTTKAYTFTVTATNSVGTSLPSLPTVAVTPSIPSFLATDAPDSLHYGKSLTVKATLTRSDTDAALGGQKVLLYRQSTPSSPWDEIRKLHTNDNGHVKTVLHPKRSAELETVFPGTAGVDRSDTFEHYKVRPILDAALSATTTVHGEHQAVTFSGTVTPYKAHQVVIRQKLVNGVWQDHGTTTVNHHGKFSFTIHTKQARTVTYRAKVAKTHKRASGHSHSVTLTVS